MKKLTFWGIIAICCGMVYSCKHEPILPDQQVSYLNDIVPIISASCMHSGCHNDTANAQGEKMNTYTDVMSSGYVDQGKPHNSKMYKSITGTGEEFMPRGNYPALNDRQIRLIYIWIAQGGKDN